LEAIEHYRKTGKKGETNDQYQEYPVYHEWCLQWFGGPYQERLNREGWLWGRNPIEGRTGRLLETGEGRGFDGLWVRIGIHRRLPVTAVFEKLEVDDLYAILKNPNNPIILGKKKDFKSYGIDIQFEEEALYDLAVKAYEEKTGARGLVSAVERFLLNFEKRLPSTDIRKFVVTRAVVEDPERALGRLLQDPSDPEMLEKFEALLQGRRWG